MSFDAVFPNAGSVVEKFVGTSAADSLQPDLLRELREVGIEGDSRGHTIRVWIAGHADPIFFSLTPGEIDRVWNLIQSGESSDPNGAPFIVFNTEAYTVILNLEVLDLSHFLFDLSGAEDPLVDSDGDVHSCKVRLFFRDRQSPLDFAVHPEDGAGRKPAGQFGSILMTMELLLRRFSRFNFRDVDGEDVFVRVANLAMLMVPRVVLNPDEFEVWAAESGY